MPGEGHPLEVFADRVAAPAPAPGGGAVAAVTAALAAALVAMVAGLARRRTASREDPALAALGGAAERLRRRLLVLAAEDERAFASVTAARRSGDPAALAAAWEAACRVPAEVVRLGRETAQLARQAALEGPAAALGDAVMAALLAGAAAAGSQVNLRLNLEAAGRPGALRVLAEGSELELEEAQRAAADVWRLVEDRLTGGGPSP